MTRTKLIASELDRRMLLTGSQTVGGILLGLCFDLPWLSDCAWVALIPFAVACRVGGAFPGTFLGLLAFHLLGLRFLCVTGSAELRLWWPVVAAGLTVAMWPVVRCAAGLVRRTRLPLVLAFPLAWVGFETLRRHLACPILGVPFPFLPLGLTVHHHPALMQSADVWGVCGLGGLVAAVNAALAEGGLAWAGAVDRRRALRDAGAVACLLVAIQGYGLLRLGSAVVEPGPRLGMSRGLFPMETGPGRGPNRKPSIGWSEFAGSATAWASGPVPDADPSPWGRGLGATDVVKVDLWIWSELALTRMVHVEADGTRGDDTCERLRQMARDSQSAYIVGGERICPRTGDRFDSLFAVQPLGQELQTYDKHFLGPGDEFQPPIARGIWLASGWDCLSPSSFNWSLRTPGRRTPILVVKGGDGRDWRLGGSICFDIWFPELFRRYFVIPQEAAPDFLVNIADEVFTGPRTDFSYAAWALVSARFRAIETRRSVVRCCGDGFCAVIDAWGRTVELADADPKAGSTLLWNVPISRGFSPQVYLGWFLPELASLICVWSLLVNLGTRRSETVAKPTPECAAGAEGCGDLTVIMPAFNEAATISAILRRVRQAAPQAQIIVVDDASTDGTANIARELQAELGVQLIRHDTNRGKGRAIRTALEHAERRFTIIQDADEEYFPEDFERLLEPLCSGATRVVFGVRSQTGVGGASSRRLENLAIQLLNLEVLLLYGRLLRDEATCYKVFDTRVLKSFRPSCERFEFCPEVTAKCCRWGHEIVEVPIRYAPRSYGEGKKIRWPDGFAAAVELLRWRFACLSWGG